MLLGLFNRSGARRSDGLQFRPTLLSLEERAVPASASVSQLAHGPALVGAPISSLGSALPINITGVTTNSAGQLVANGTLGSTPLTLPLALTPDPTATNILNLHLGPIHLDLLGLKVDTSQICLDITAQPGPGNLLGNLLSNVANLLNQGSPLGTVLGGLTSGQLTTLTNGLTGLLNGAFSTITTPFSGSTSDVSATTSGTTSILHLSVGPVNLNLLGLNVHLDDCNGGPVTVDISAQSGPGNLLGNLISGLAGILDRPGNRVGQVGHALQDIIGAIGQLI
jgi:hypothetical protein